MASESEEPPHYPYAKMGRDEAQKQLAYEIGKFFDDFFNLREATFDSRNGKPLSLLDLRIGINTPPFRRQIIAPAGMGKTRTVAQNLSRCHNNEVIWFVVPRLKLAEEVAETIRKESGIEVKIVKGRSEETCARHKLAKTLGGRGVNVQKTLCDNGEVQCEYFDECPYQQQREELKSSSKVPCTYVMAHAYLTSQAGAPKPDLVIVDESHWQNFIDITGQPSSAPNLTFGDLQRAKDKDIENHEDYQNVIKRIIKAMDSNPTRFMGDLSKMICSGYGLSVSERAIPPLLPPINPEELDLAIKHIKSVVNKNRYTPITPNSPDYIIKNMLRNWNVPKLKKIEGLLLTLRYELKKKKRSSSIVCQEDKAIRIHGLKQNMIDKNTPVLLIDASASYDINSKIWGHHLQNIEVKAERHATVTQVKKRTFSKSSLGIPYNKEGNWEPEDKQLEFRKELIDFINEVASQEDGDIFLAAPKSVKAVLKSQLAANVLTSHFSAIRGSNLFEHCEVAIIIGREQPPIEAIENMARALLSRSEETFLSNIKYIPTQRGRRLVNGETEQETVSYHIFPFPQEILEQIREREVEQAIDRLRLMHNPEPKTIYLLSSIVLDITVDYSVTWEQLAHLTKMDQAICTVMGNGETVFPLGATDIARLFPDLWATPDQVKGDTKRRGGIKWVVCLIRYYIPNDPLYLVEYRRTGQRGKPSRAIAFGSPENAPTALKNALGGISKFKIIEQIHEGNENDEH